MIINTLLTGYMQKNSLPVPRLRQIGRYMICKNLLAGYMQKNSLPVPRLRQIRGKYNQQYTPSRVYTEKFTACTPPVTDWEIYDLQKSPGGVYAEKFIACTPPVTDWEIYDLQRSPGRVYTEKFTACTPFEIEMWLCRGIFFVYTLFRHFDTKIYIICETSRVLGHIFFTYTLPSKSPLKTISFH